MPTYEFECPNGHHFEKFEKMSAKATAKCPQCGKTARRLISGGAGFVFKGSGFYQTDYKNTNVAPKGDAAKHESGKGEGAKSEGAKSEGTGTGAKADSTKPKPGSKKADS